MASQKPLFILLVTISIVAYVSMGYVVQRHETLPLFAFYFLAFAVYIWVLRHSKPAEIKYWLYTSIFFRMLLLFSIPALSDDFYRFIWDGRLLANGFHPFAELPGFYLEKAHAVNGLNQFLYDHLNSEEYFTVYPPLSQVIFWVAAFIFPGSILGSVVVMRMFIVAAEIGSLYIIQKMLKAFEIDKKNILIYALNPLVILELTGNLHFEAFVILFLLLVVYWLMKSKIWQAGVSMGFAICIKLLPLILLPLFFLRLGLRRSFQFYFIALGIVLLLFIPLFYEDRIDGLSESLGLYFKKFEFNASIYYLVREWGFYTKGYNIIQTVGWKLGVIAAVGILMISFWPFEVSREGGNWKLMPKKYSTPNDYRQMPLVMMWILFFYFLMTTTLHPWYLTTLLMLSVFTPYRFMMVWSGTVFLTYAGYTEMGYHEIGYLVAIEYVLVIGYLVYEWIWRRKFAYR